MNPNEPRQWPWELFTGTGSSLRDRPWELPPVPSWRHQRDEGKPVFVMPDGLADAVNAALHLRRPLLLTGAAGSGKSTLARILAEELDLGPLLKWHITSKSVLTDGLYRYDALDRLHATQNGDGSGAVEEFVTLGPLGTALADSGKPRAVLIDEIDKSDLDLPGDLLDTLERGEFRIPPLVRTRSGRAVEIDGIDGGSYPVTDGRVQTEHYPVIVFTSNQERTFAPPFLRRCVRYKLEPFTPQMLAEIVDRHLNGAGGGHARDIEAFAGRLERGETLAINQLVEMVHLVTGHRLPEHQEGTLKELLLRELTER